ncbi:MAG: hypothetical protein WC341_14300, partial [Bacteroidales bacterium]
MNLYAVSIAYYEPDVIGMSVGKFFRTSGVENIECGISKWIFVNNHWPIKPNNMNLSVNQLAKFMNAEVVTPEKNLGGHGGFSFGIKNLKFEDDDLILNYDLDSYPETYGWLKAMVETMQADKTLGYVALLNNKEVGHPGKTEIIGGHKVLFPDKIYMWNVTLFRGSVMREGMLADSTYYGYVETAMRRKIDAMGLRMGYMEDCRESNISLPQNPIYYKYKRAHAHEKTFNGSFE